ncbi:MAG: hypothetical protein ACR5K4_02770 [Sodalis sp. (in: enterobacteria)]
MAKWKAPVILVFDERQVNVLNAWPGIRSELHTVRICLAILLPVLRESQKFTQLIKKGFLDVEDHDLQCLQQFATLVYMYD